MVGKPLFVQTLQLTLQAYLYRRNYNLLSDINTSNYDIKYYFCCDTRYTCYNYPFIQLSRTIGIISTIGIFSEQLS